MSGNDDSSESARAVRETSEQVGELDGGWRPYAQLSHVVTLESPHSPLTLLPRTTLQHYNMTTTGTTHNSTCLDCTHSSLLSSRSMCRSTGVLRSSAAEAVLLSFLSTGRPSFHHPHLLFVPCRLLSSSACVLLSPLPEHVDFTYHRSPGVIASCCSTCRLLGLMLCSALVVAVQNSASPCLFY